MTKLVLGPLLRYVDETSATVWVETDEPATVDVLGCTTRTFHVRGHHYALVPIRGLRPGTTTPYEVKIDGEAVWPTEPDSPSRITTIAGGKDTKLRLWFGSCHFGETDDPQHRDQLGTDALEACARDIADLSEPDRPEVLLLLGDQIYADQTTPRLQREMRLHRDLDRPPGTEIADFEEYTQLYRHAWSGSSTRWLLSAIPTMMIFDDHDIRDDWNTSQAWRAQMARTPWWRNRLLGGLISYWIYQHIGNLGPDELARDPLYRTVVDVGRSGDAWDVLHDFAAHADVEREGRKGARWSYYRNLGPIRLVVIDTRGGRMLDTTERAMLSDSEFEWLAQSVNGDHEHVVLASSLPWLLPPVIHHAQSWNESACTSRGRFPKMAEKLRQLGDLEHWAAFRASFDHLSAMVEKVARERTSVSVLSGDVHHSYLADAEFPGPQPPNPVVQVTCSPLHNAVPRLLRAPLTMAWWKPLAGVLRRIASRAGVAPLPLTWSKSAGPYFGNTVGVLDFDDQHAQVSLLQAGEDGNLTSICRRELA